ncbi:MAG: FAD-dependent oxidoreductase [Solirubrobacteraceae bacterium]
MPKLHAIQHRPKIVIAGAGVAGLEALMALRAMVGGTVEIELLSPDVEFSYRQISVGEPFGLGEVRRFDLATIAADHSAHLRADALVGVDLRARVALTVGGLRVGFDYLIVATGARPITVIDGAVRFGGPADRPALEHVLADARAGTVRRLVFAAPPELAWVLPLYELALLTAAWASRCELTLDLALVTPEARPLEAFGQGASDTVAGLLREADIAIHTDCAAERFESRQLVAADGRTIDADAVIALPGLVGREIDGLPHDDRGFIPTDPHGAVRASAGVYAAGDGTAFPIKQGGLAAQQADAVAEAIAAELGAVPAAEPFRPVLRGLLLTASEPRYLRAELDAGVSEVAFRPLWWPPGKVAGRYLAPYLAHRGDPELLRTPLEDREAPAQSESAAQAIADERDAVELLLELAEANARRGSYDFAVKCLDAAEDVGGPLPSAGARKRRQWQQRARTR